jgi:hypothetical protein
MASLVTEKYRNVSSAEIDGWVDKFHRDGFLFLESFLEKELVKELRQDLDKALEGNENPEASMELHHAMFEKSQGNLSLFDLEPMVSFAEKLVAPNCQVFHNNSFRTHSDGINSWHQDDDLHYVVKEGDPPQNINLPVLFFTANYYLTDVESLEKGPTQLVPGSHLLGRRPPGSERAVHGTVDAMEGTEYEDKVFSALGGAGSVICFNNQVWHRGGPNSSGSTRYITQVSYGRRMIGGLWPPYVNYQMPKHVYENADDRLLRLLGFKKPGAYA